MQSYSSSALPLAFHKSSHLHLATANTDNDDENIPGYLKVLIKIVSDTFGFISLLVVCAVVYGANLVIATSKMNLTETKNACPSEISGFIGPLSSQTMQCNFPLYHSIYSFLLSCFSLTLIFIVIFTFWQYNKHLKCCTFNLMPYVGIVFTLFGLASVIKFVQDAHSIYFGYQLCIRGLKLDSTEFCVCVRFVCLFFVVFTLFSWKYTIFLCANGTHKSCFWISKAFHAV